MQKVKTDTTVVPQGVVAAMKALREKEGNTEGKTIKYCPLRTFVL